MFRSIFSSHMAVVWDLGGLSLKVDTGACRG